MSFIASNLKILRKARKLTQAKLAKEVGVSRASIGSYEEGRCEPPIALLHDMAKLFDLSIESLVATDLANDSPQELKADNKPSSDMEENKDRPYTVIVSEKDTEQERIAVVPVTARAGYSTGIMDPSYISKLPTFNLPLPEISKFKSYRVFQIAGDSMVPIIDPGDYLLTEYVENWREMKDGETYVLVTQSDGILYKRVTKNKDQLNLVSENTEYDPFEIPAQEVMELWKPKGRISFRI